MRIVTLEDTARSPQVGLVLADRDPEPILGRALRASAQRADGAGALEGLARLHLHPARTPLADSGQPGYGST